MHNARAICLWLKPGEAAGRRVQFCISRVVLGPLSSMSPRSTKPRSWTVVRELNPKWKSGAVGSSAAISAPLAPASMMTDSISLAASPVELKSPAGAFNWWAPVTSTLTPRPACWRKSRSSAFVRLPPWLTWINWAGGGGDGGGSGGGDGDAAQALSSTGQSEGAFQRVLLFPNLTLILPL